MNRQMLRIFVGVFGGVGLILHRNVRTLPEAKRLAGVGSEDPDAAWSYPLSAAQARAVAKLIGAEIDRSAAGSVAAA